LPDHAKWMRATLVFAKRELGNVAPNPSVGCLLVKNDIVVGRGWTQRGGRPHAETQALAMAKDAAKGATAYVSLEPCSHHGKTPPCAEALVREGVEHVVVAVEDPDPRVSGQGIHILNEAGIKTTVGILAEEAKSLNAGFFLKNVADRPYFTLKTAASIDGKIATATGESKWITGPKARSFSHLLRAQHDGILVGVNTVVADDPNLTCRVEGLEKRSPEVIVLDSKLRIPLDCNLLKNTDKQLVHIVCDEKSASTQNGDPLRKMGANLIEVADTHNLKEVAKRLANQGFTRVLVEGGAQVLASFVASRQCDRLHVFRAGKLIGAEGLSSIGDLALARLADAPHLTLESYRKLGSDLLATYRNAE